MERIDYIYKVTGAVVFGLLSFYFGKNADELLRWTFFILLCFTGLFCIADLTYEKPKNGPRNKSDIPGGPGEPTEPPGDRNP